MARIATLGFESNTTSANVEWTSFANATIQSSVVRSGSYAGRTNSVGVGTSFKYQFSAANSSAEYYFRTYFRINVLPTGTLVIEQIENAAGSAKVGFQLTAGGKLQLWNLEDNVQIGSDSAATFTTGVWYRAELKVNATTPSATVIEGRYATENQTATSFASGTINLASGIAALEIGTQTAVEDVDLYWDDIAINNTSGTSENSWPTPGNVVHMQPNAAGDNNQWAVGAGGTAGVANNYTRVLEVTPDEATTYNKRTAVGTLIDDFNVESSSSAGIGAGDAITLVQIGARLGATSTSSSNRTGIFRIKGQASGTVSESASIAFNVNGWATNSITTPRTSPLTAYVNPQTGTAWTPTTLDTMQIGYKSGSSSTNEIRVSTLFAIVEYVPATLQTLTTTHTTDANKKGTLTKTHTADAAKKIVPTLTFTTDTYGHRSPTLTHTADANKRGALTRTHTADAVKRIVPTLTHSTDSFLRAAVVKIHTTDALRRSAVTAVHSTDSYRHYSFNLTFTTDALLRKANTTSHTTDSLNRAASTKTHTTDSNRHVEATLAHTTDSYLSSVLQVFTLEFTTDTLLRAVNTISHLVDATMKVSLQTFTSTDALLRKEVGLTFTTNALLKVGPELTHTTGSFVRSSPALTFTTDSYRHRTVTLAHSTDAFLYNLLTLTTTHTTDARLGAELYGAWSETWDYTISDFTKTHSTDAFLRLSANLTFTTDSLLRAGTTVAFTTDSLLRAINTLTHTVDSALRIISTVEHSTDALLKVSNTQSHTTDTILSRLGITLAHTTDTSKRIEGTLTFTTDSDLRKGFEISHSTDAFALLTEVTHDTDALLRKARTVSHRTSSRLRKGHRQPESWYYDNFTTYGVKLVTDWSQQNNTNAIDKNSDSWYSKNTDTWFDPE